MHRRLLSIAAARAPARRVVALRERLADEAPRSLLPPHPHSPFRRTHRQRLRVSLGSFSRGQAREPTAAAARAPPPPMTAPQLSALHDSFGRHHTYLRISLTEKCSLRCTYCMPPGGVDLTPAERLLSTREILRLARLFVGAGTTKIRLTGGEPTLRRDLTEIVSALDELRPAGLRTIGMTSNGIALSSRRLRALRDAGLDKLNLSLDTLDAQRFAKLARRDGLKLVLRAIDAAIDEGFEPLKINCVVMRGVNDDEVRGEGRPPP